MAALRQPQYDDSDSRRLAAHAHGALPLPQSFDGSPARGIVVGVMLSVVGFWLPALGAWLALR